MREACCLLLLATLPAPWAASQGSKNQDASSRGGNFIALDPFDQVKQIGDLKMARGYPMRPSLWRPNCPAYQADASP